MKAKWLKRVGIVVVPFLFLFLFIFGSSIVSKKEEVGTGGGIGNYPPEVLRWKEKVEEECKKNGIPEAVNYILGLIMVESGGNAEQYPDIMQASESQGRPPNSISDPNESIEVGVSYFASAYKKHKDHDLLNIVQGYNYGYGYLDYAEPTYSLDTAIAFSKKMANGQMVSYTNPIAMMLGYSYRYNYGNMFYAQIVKQYIDSANNSEGGGHIGNGQYSLPVDNPVVSSGFGGRYWGDGSYEFHRGLDFANPSGTPIKAIADGKVVRAEFHYSWGNHIVIQHDDGRVSLYAHQSQMIAKVGDKVSVGQVIGKIGSTGNSTGPHLHLELSKSMDLSEGNLLNPADFLGL